jgi:transcriptional regulator with XRE-family HTH domain
VPRLTAHRVTVQLGKRVVELRQAKGLSQEQLGEFIGLSDRGLRRIEHAQVDVTIGMLVRLANALGVSLQALLSAPTRNVVQKRGRPARRAGR